jgi:hypothetical protein
MSSAAPPSYSTTPPGTLSADVLIAPLAAPLAVFWASILVCVAWMVFLIVHERMHGSRN